VSIRDVIEDMVRTLRPDMTAEERAARVDETFEMLRAGREECQCTEPNTCVVCGDQ
jgi:hypothetical protein